MICDNTNYYISFIKHIGLKIEIMGSLVNIILIKTKDFISIQTIFISIQTIFISKCWFWIIYIVVIYIVVIYLN